MSVMWTAALAAPLLIAWFVIEALRRSGCRAVLAGVPNERSLHAPARPRLGGLGVMAGALPVMAWAGDAPVVALAACAFVLALVSLADDVRSLPIAVRLPAQIAAAAFAILAIGGPAAARDGLDVVEAGFAILALVWMTNLYNFMDGSDGLAGGMALAGFGAAARALASRSMGPRGQLAIIGGWVVLYAALFIAIERRVRQAAN